MEMKWLAQVINLYRQFADIANSPKKRFGSSGSLHMPPFTNAQPDLDLKTFFQGEVFLWKSRSLCT